jgi:O-antigen ligase
MKYINLKILRSNVFHRFDLIDQPNQHWLIGLLIISLLILPFTFMTFRGLLGALSAICLLLSIAALFIKSESSNSFFEEKYLNLIIFYSIASPATILITQLIRGHLFLPSFDSPIRLLAALPILIAIHKHRINFSKLLSFSIPLALLGIFTFTKFSTHHLYGDRLTNYYLDPIFWGNFSIILGVISFASIESRDQLLIKIYKLSGLVLGISMSVLSQSRAGWVAAIVMMIFWLIINKKVLTLKKSILHAIFVMLILLTLYLFLTSFKLRVDTAVAEIINWLSGAQRISSTGIRLTMWEMTIHLLSLNPWLGYGESYTLAITDDAYIRSFADPESIKIIICCGPHNEIAGHGLRSGVFGIAALLAAYLIPIYVFLRLNNSQSTSMGIMLCTGIFVCGFSTEMLGLKISSTFYAILVSGLIATALWQNNKSHEQK